VPPARPPLWRRLREAGGLGVALPIAALYVVVLLMDMLPLEPVPYRVGQYLPADVRARLTFEVASPKALVTEPGQDETTPASFKLDEDLVRQIGEDLEKLPETILGPPSPPPATQPATMPAEPAAMPTTAPAEGQIDRQAVIELLGPGGREEYQKAIQKLLADLRKLCILEGEEAKRQINRKARTIHLYGATAEPVVRSVTAIFSAVADSQIEQLSPDKLRRQLAVLVKNVTGPIAPRVLEYLEKVFIVDKKGLYLYDAEKTEKESIRLVAPPAAGKVYRRGEVLVPASRRQLIGGGEEVAALGPAELELLTLERDAYVRAERKAQPWRLWGRVAGRAAVLLAAVLALCAYVRRYDARLARDAWQAVKVSAVLAAMVALAKIAGSGREWNQHVVLLPVMMGAMVIAIAYDQRFALALGSFLALLVVLQTRASLPLMLVLLTGVVVSVIQLRQIRTRSKLIEVAAITAAATFAIVWAQGWIRGVPVRFTLVDGVWAAGAALLAGFLIQGLLPLVERLFGIATDMTLLEWCDASKPLLKTLAMQAPGTYNHCLQLGAMCESAAETIGARGLLARTGAYYHDIGKINKPEYFVENQSGASSKHAKLSPAMSLLIITGHVKDGLEMAREYNLPGVLHEFIATHHGTTLVQYFYQAAADQRKNGAQAAPDEMEFRYPGPKPRSKEAAILMLADASESSVRSMTDPTPGRIENQVHTMVNRRLMDSQLDECDLTLQEVHAIEGSLVRSLCGIYHARIAYPTPPGEKPAAAETPQPKPAQ